VGFYVGMLIKLLIPVLVSIYTLNFGRWLAKQGSVSGAIGAYLWSLLCTGVPAAVLWINR
jgi:hypothetical protein